jgi:hypothetical protein
MTSHWTGGHKVDKIQSNKGIVGKVILKVCRVASEKQLCTKPLTLLTDMFISSKSRRQYLKSKNITNLGTLIFHMSSR